MNASTTTTRPVIDRQARQFGEPNLPWCRRRLGQFKLFERQAQRAKAESEAARKAMEEK